MYTGLDRLQREPSLLRHLEGRIGYLGHSASVDRNLRHGADILHQLLGARLTALFGPQHGFNTDAQDNMIESPHDIHPVYGIPVFSLYSETREPTPEMLRHIDTLVIDLNDIGVRVYTYIWTMVLAMRACNRNGVKVVILDRPNPLDGITIEGNMLEMPFTSFVGLHPLPMRHGMTIGEMARYASRFWDAGPEPVVIACEGLNRTWGFAQTGLPWVFPSPNLATLDTLAIYPGFVLFEGTQLSEGRGTVRPFELFGHPVVRSSAWADRINSALHDAAHEIAALKSAASNHSEHRNQVLKNAAHENVEQEVAAHHNASREISALENTSQIIAELSSYKVRPHVFVPTFEKWEGQICYGYQIHRMDAGRSGSWMAAQIIMRELYALMGDDFKWRPPPFEYENNNIPIDILNGTDRIRQWIEAQGSVSELHEIAMTGQDVFLQQRREVLLYT